MQRERVADDIYVFTSEQYAQVTAGAVITSEGAVLVDTLLFPEETRQIKQFIETRLGCPVRYVINTHYHADHTYGTCMFPDAIVVAHARCFDLLDTRGREGLEQARASMAELESVRLVLPHLVFENSAFHLRVGNKSLQLWHTPGHSMDSIVVLVREDRVLFAADTLMPLPHFADGDYEALSSALRSLQNNVYECIVQGHGEVILRGEIETKIQSDLSYLAALKKYVELARTKSEPEKYLDGVDAERCGKSRILLGGSAQKLHKANLRTLYSQISNDLFENSPLTR
jgi:cyclase